MTHKGTHLTDEMKRKIAEQQMNELNHQWKGDDVKYQALHQWIRKNKTKPEACEKCGAIRILELANISGAYKRDVNDFIYLCVPCHRFKDVPGFTGRRHSDGSKSRMSLAKKDKKLPDEHKENISNSIKEWWKKKKENIHREQIL